eukprot:297821_1
MDSRTTLAYIVLTISYLALHTKALVSCINDKSCKLGGIGGIGCLTPKKCRQCNYKDPTANNVNQLEPCPEDLDQLTSCSNDSRCATPGSTPINPDINPGIPPLSKPFKSMRNFRIENQCKFPIWVGFNAKSWITNEFDGNQIPNDGGWYMHANQQKTVTIPNLQSGAIWARTNCGNDTEYNDQFTPFTCDTGQCWTPFNEYGANGKCCGLDKQTGKYMCAGPGSPTSLAEFSLSNDSNQNDFYDVSLVDGYNIPLLFKPIPGSYVKEETIDHVKVGENACGNAAINTFDARHKCPYPMKHYGTANKEKESFDFKSLIYCKSICKSVDNANTLLKQWRDEQDASEVLKEFYSDGDDVSQQKDKRLLDLLCCQCGPGNYAHGCYDNNATCNYGCTPYLDHGFLDPNVWHGTRDQYLSRTCPNFGYKDDISKVKDWSMPLWPLIADPSGAKMNPAYLYRHVSPNAYAWQFDDISATYVCRNADYQITFCHDEATKIEDNSKNGSLQSPHISDLLQSHHDVDPPKASHSFKDMLMFVMNTLKACVMYIFNKYL